uniref:G_PROTEIN_RECEP_F1_2 domain-containing protein n=1 Tax=Panagrellus redivivus TaxID=6233 RepID=A0A7E4UMC3_PANRE
MPLPVWCVDLPPETVNAIFLGIDVLEVILLLGTLPITGITFYLFYKCPLIHRNTVYLGINIYIVYLVLTMTRLIGIFISISLGDDDNDEDYYIGVPISTAYLSGPIATVELLRLIASGVFIGICPCLVVERLFATLYIKTYESGSHPRFLGLVIALQWICAAIVVYLFCMDLISLFIIVGFVLFVTFFCLVVFAYCKIINNRQYRQYQRNSISLTLSERYQLAENMRTTRLLYKLVVGMVICNVICILMFMIMAFGKGNFIRKLLRAVFNYAVLVYSYAFPIAVITTVTKVHPMLERLKTKFLKFRHPRIHVEEVREDLRRRLGFLVNSKGRPMVFDLEKEPKVYFETLTNIWNGPISPAAKRYIVEENAN